MGKFCGLPEKTSLASGDEPHQALEYCFPSPEHEPCGHGDSKREAKHALIQRQVQRDGNRQRKIGLHEPRDGSVRDRQAGDTQLFRSC